MCGDKVAEELDALEIAEPIKSKVAFQDYLALGPGRTVDVLFEKYCKAAEGTGIKPYASLSQLKHWRTTFKWDARVVEAVKAATPSIEDDMNRLDLLRLEHDKAVKQIEEWDEVQREHRSRMVVIGSQLLDKAVQMLEIPVYKDQIDEDGVTVIRMPGKWSAGDIARYVEVADKVVRLAAELDTNRTHTTVVDEAKVRERASELGLDYSAVLKRATEIANGKSS